MRTLLDGASPQGQEIMPGAEYLMGVAIETDQGRTGLLVVADKESRQGTQRHRMRAIRVRSRGQAGIL